MAESREKSDACEVCGNEERNAAGLFTCECPAPVTGPRTAEWFYEMVWRHKHVYHRVGRMEFKPEEGFAFAEAYAKYRGEASRRDALEEAAKICEGFIAECTARPNCHSLDACEIRALKV